MNLIECLESVKDPGRKQGQRYSSVAMLLIIIISILRGKYAYREAGRFCALHSAYLIKRFGFKNGKVPSYVSIRSFVMSVDFACVQAAFHQWAQDYVPIEAGEWIAVDGKSIRSTVSGHNNEYQNFVSLVSLFSSKREQILHAEKFENKKGSEAQVVEDLLAFLDLKDVVLTLDALHCKKNSKKDCRKR